MLDHRTPADVPPGTILHRRRQHRFHIAKELSAPKREVQRTRAAMF
jgi:hypothetical protein